MEPGVKGCNRAAVAGCLVILVLALIVGLVAWRRHPAKAGKNALHFTPHACDRSLGQHVYRPERLITVSGHECITVQGWVREKEQEPDGDLTFELELVPADLQDYPDLINDKNRERQHGRLQVEMPCARPPRTDNAEHACHGWSNPGVPDDLREGDYVEVFGPHVKDDLHKWMEIHPAQVQILVLAHREKARRHNSKRY